MTPPRFVGRSSELLHLRSLVQPGSLITVLGTEGIGKSRLVDAAGLTPEPHWVHGHQAIPRVGQISAPILVLDGVEGLTGSERAAIAAHRQAGVAVIATSRDVLGLPGEQALALPPLPYDDAISLVMVRRMEAGAAPMEVPLAGRLVHAVGAMPLALELVAGRSVDYGADAAVQAITSWIEAHQRTGARMVRSTRVRIAVDWAVGLLSPSDLDVLIGLAAPGAPWRNTATERRLRRWGLAQPLPGVPGAWTVPPAVRERLPAQTLS